MRTVRNVIVQPRKGLAPGELQTRQRAMDSLRPATHPRLWLTRDQAASALGISTRSVDRHKANGELGYYRGPVPGFDAALRFWAADVDRLVSQQNRD
jgi:hypothetical protein